MPQQLIWMAIILLGISLFLVGMFVYALVTGRMRTRYGRLITREENPVGFWISMVAQIMFMIFFFSIVWRMLSHLPFIHPSP